MSAITIPAMLSICVRCENELALDGLLCAGCRADVERNLAIWRDAAAAAENLLCLERGWKQLREVADRQAEATSRERGDWSVRRSAAITLLAVCIMAFAVWMASEFCR